MSPPAAASPAAGNNNVLPNRLRPLPAGQGSGPVGGTWAVASDQGAAIDNSRAAKIWAIDPRAIEDSLATDKQPAASRLPGDNSLPKGQFQMADEITVRGPQPAAPRDPRSAANGLPLPQDSWSGPPRAVRQTEFQVAQPTGETVGLGSVDPLAVSRSLAVAPALPNAPPPGLMLPPAARGQMPPFTPPLPPAPRPNFAPPAGMAMATNAGTAPRFTSPGGMAMATDAGATLRPIPAAVSPAPAGIAVASDAAIRPAPAGVAVASDAAVRQRPRAPAPNLYAPGQSIANPPDANPLRGSDNVPARRAGDFSAPDWSQMPDSVIGANSQNPLR